MVLHQQTKEKMYKIHTKR